MYSFSLSVDSNDVISLNFHETLGHQGYRVIVANLPEREIHITRGKRLLKSIASRCMKCRLFRRRLLEQQIGHLPKFCFISYSPPFTSIAFNYFGPVKIKKTRNVIIDSSIILITCITTRVIHLKITEIQTTDDFLLPWWRFIFKSCVHPVHVYSDSGKVFVGAQKPIRNWISSWDVTKIKSSLAVEGRTIDFI